MQKNSNTDRNDVSRPLPEPRVLVQEEAVMIAGGNGPPPSDNLGRGPTGPAGWRSV
jgi:hypothetical protein